MILTVHIVLASLSLLLATVNVFFPSKTKLKSVYVLTIGAAVSGVLLGFTTHTNVAQACISGSVYLGFIIASSFIAHRRLSLRATSS